jgi:hypothetical protein
MLRIQRSINRGVVFSLSGRIQIEDVSELQRILDLEAVEQSIALDLQDITILDRDALQFLARCEADGIKLENSPAYVRHWLATERNQRGHQSHSAKRRSPEADQS